MHLGAEAGARDRHQVRDDGDGGRIAAGAEARKGRLRRRIRLDAHEVLAALRTRASGDDSGTSAGRTDANSCLSRPGARSAHDTWRIVQSSFRAYVKSTRSIDEIERHGMCFGIHLAAQSDGNQNRDLRARVVAVDVRRSDRPPHIRAPALPSAHRQTTGPRCPCGVRM